MRPLFLPAIFAVVLMHVPALAGDCCQSGSGPGCDNSYVEQCVCTGDPYCCEMQWNNKCVSEVEKFGCGSCGGCIPFCADKECGPDGCGGSCGSCGFAQACSPEGLCIEPCKPDCVDRQCGDDGCGGYCGSCSEAKWCSEETGQCLSYGEENRTEGVRDTRGQNTGDSLPSCGDSMRLRYGKCVSADSSGAEQGSAGCVVGRTPLPLSASVLFFAILCLGVLWRWSSSWVRWARNM